MKYICLGYFNKPQREGMADAEQNALFDNKNFRELTNAMVIPPAE